MTKYTLVLKCSVKKKHCIKTTQTASFTKSSKYAFTCLFKSIKQMQDIKFKGAYGGMALEVHFVSRYSRVACAPFSVIRSKSISEYFSRRATVLSSRSWRPGESSGMGRALWAEGLVSCGHRECSSLCTPTNTSCKILFICSCCSDNSGMEHNYREREQKTFNN